jgi:hypothetical protein
MPHHVFQSTINVLKRLKPAVFGQNLLLALFFGAAVSFWIIRYTDWGEVVFGLLALTGLFSWLALVMKLLLPKTIEDLQNQIEQVAFRNPDFRYVMVLLFFVTVLLASCLGTIEIKSVRETSDRAVRAYRNQRPEKADETVPPGHYVRFVFWTFLARPSLVHVKVDGYPEKTVRVYPFGRELLQTATSFLQAVVLLRPDPAFIELRDDQYRIVVRKLGAQQSASADFDGHALWVNTDSEVDIPGELLDSWRAEAGGQSRPGLMTFWQHPKAFPVPLELQPGDSFSVCTIQQNQECCAKDPVTVQAPPLKEYVPQVVPITVFSDCHAKP